MSIKVNDVIAKLQRVDSEIESILKQLVENIAMKLSTIMKTLKKDFCITNFISS